MFRAISKVGAALFAAFLLGFFLSPSYAQTEVRLGYQRGNISSALIEQKFIENALGDDVKVTWTLFSAGPPLLEAMNAGEIDFGLTGDTPPVFAQAGGVPLRYVASQKTPTNEALIVPADSPITRVEDLAGKKVGYTVGSSANYTLVKILETAGLSLDDVESVPLQPADARAAFQGGSLDAWVIWDPFLTAAVTDLGAKTLLSRTDVGEYRWFYLTSEDFGNEHLELVTEILTQLQVATDWVTQNPERFADILSQETGVDSGVWQDILASRPFGKVEPFAAAQVTSQQEVADTFYTLGTLPVEIRIADALWQQETVQKP